MVIVSVKYLVMPGDRDKVLQFAMESRAIARTQPGNVEYCAMPSPNENEIMSIEKWETLEHLQSYIQTEGCKNFIAKRAPYLVEGSKITEIYQAELTDFEV